MKNAFKIIELLFDELNLLHGVDAMSLVHDPAIEIDFVHFNKEYNTNFSKIDEEKRIVTGPALIPNKMILRKQGEDYFYVYFSEDTIFKTAKRFLKDGHQNNSTLEHQVALEGISVVESWIISDKVHDKSVKFGYDLPIGTWMLSSYIENDEVWEKVKSGEIKGYSIEGRYSDNVLAAAKEQPNLVGTDEEKDLYNKIVALINEIQ